MFVAERKFKIIEYVRKHNAASVSTLAREFKVHEATIRRDLAEIEQEGLLKRTHGGVVFEQWTEDEPSFSERTTQNLEEKMRMGEMAASMVEDGDQIIIDSGTTTLHIAKNLINRTNITVITNDMNVAVELRDSPRIKVIVTGGELYPSSYMLNGMFTDHVLGSIHTLKAFIGTPVLHPQYGLMHPKAELVPAKQGMIRAAQKVIVVTDHTKIGRFSLYSVAPKNAIHTLITGRDASAEDLKPFAESGIEIFTV